MNKALEELLRPYNPLTPLDWNHAIREVVQEIALVGFWRSGFFEHAAFYGGTALRIFHGLNRFSEDLDFSLIREQDPLRLPAAFSAVETEMAAWGFSFEAESKSSGERTGIESAFLKGNTRINLLSIGVPDELSRHFPHNQKFTIKLELDTTPPPFAITEVKTRLLPTPFQVRLYDLPSLFAGKLHALLFRDWKSRVKGRDFYDFIWYISHDVPVNLPHLEARIVQSGNRQPGRLDLDAVQTLLRQRIESVDIRAAAEEVRPFLRDSRELALWSEDFFIDGAAKLKESRS
ncbi:MAG: nucleotidyl transferase AbiEii/AbiGii toxin family protein [Kiritimatiellales bacterium]